MIKFFRNIRQNLLMENLPTGQAGKTSKPASPAGRYFFYALGEIILVVIGILIALQINNWNQEKIGHNLERVYLQNLIGDLESQLLELERQRNNAQFVKEALKRVTANINNGFSEADLTQYNQDMQSIVITRTLNLYDATFQDLKSTGNMNLISNETLKQDILNYFQLSNRDVYVIRKNAEGYHYAITQEFMGSLLVNFDLKGMKNRLSTAASLSDSLSLVKFDPRVESLLNTQLANRLTDLDNQQKVKNMVSNRWYTIEINLQFSNEMANRTLKLITELKKELN